MISLGLAALGWPYRAARHPRVQVALKGAFAASAAWFVAVRLLPDDIATYAYYAPLGAVLAIHPTVRRSVTESARFFASIALGVTIALLTDAVLGVSVLTVALVVAVGILTAAVPWLGARGWVPTAALVTLVVGSHDTQNYVLAYAGLTLMGAALAVVVNTILPALPLQRSARSLTDLRDTVADELDALADSYGPPADAGAHTERSSHRHLDHLLEEMRHAVRESGEAAHANRRARNNARRCGTCAVKRRRSSSSGSSFTTSVFSSTSMSPAADHLARPPRSGSRPPRRCALLPLRCGR